MSDTPTFSFGVPSSGGGSVVFGQTSSDGGKVQSSPFGSNTSTASTNPTPFNNTAATSGAPLFGQGSSASQTSSAFGAFGGNGSGVGGKPSGISFGSAATGDISSGSFSAGQTQSPTSQPPIGSASLGFSGFPASNKPLENPTAIQGQKAGTFSTANSTGFPGLFGTTNSKDSQAEASTPISKPGTGITFAPSTTPIGPPPSDTGVGAKSSSVVFNPFGPKNTAQPTTQDPSTSTAPSNAFGGFLKFSPSQYQGNISSFNKPLGNSGTSSLSKPANSEGGLFNNLNNSKDNGLLNSAPSNPGTAQQTKLPSLFSNLSGHPPGATSTTQTSGNSLFSGSTQNSLTGTSKPSAFSSSFSKPAPSPSSTAPSALGLSDALGGQGKSLRMSAPLSSASDLEKPKEGATNSADDIKAIGQTSGQQPLPTSAAKSSLFAGLGQSTTSSASAHPTTQAATADISDNTNNPNPILGASTTGPTPPTKSQLKNKSMDEIITRWATDLSKYQKDFQKQAEQVSVWDRMLVENSEKIQKLYGSTLEAERATTEVERQLTAVENDQEELATWLDHHEKEVDKMMSTQVVQGESLQGPDQERERTYKLAEKLSTRLEEMGKDLGEMIGEINDASSTLSKHKKADDPLSQVVKVLNSHLSQLQLIDQGAAALHAKVAAAQKVSQSMGSSNGFNGPNSDAADGFYRSYMGRR